MSIDLCNPLTISVLEKAQKGGKPVEQWISLAYIKKKRIESRAQELAANWRQTKTQDKENKSTRVLHSTSRKSMSKVLGHIAKKYTSHYLQLKFRHGAVGNYLAMIGVIETPPPMLAVGPSRTVG